MPIEPPETRERPQSEAPANAAQKMDWPAVGRALPNVLLVLLVSLCLYCLIEWSWRNLPAKHADTLTQIAIVALFPVMGAFAAVVWPSEGIVYGETGGLFWSALALVSMLACLLHFVGKKRWNWWSGLAMALLVGWGWGTLFGMTTMTSGSHRVSAVINELRGLTAANWVQYVREADYPYQWMESDPAAIWKSLDLSPPSCYLVKRTCMIASEGDKILVGFELTDRFYEATGSGYDLALGGSRRGLKGSAGEAYEKGLRAVFMEVGTKRPTAEER